MPKYLYVNVIGAFVVSDNLKVIDQEMFHSVKDISSRKLSLARPGKKYKHLDSPSPKMFLSIESLFQDKKHQALFHDRNLDLSKQAVKEAITDDIWLMQCMAAIEDMEKVQGILIRRLTEWYGLQNPEGIIALVDQEKMVELIIKKELKKQANSMGRALLPEMEEKVIELAKQIRDIQSSKNSQQAFLEKSMKNNFPNLCALSPPDIIARMMKQAGSLKNFMELPASTIQLLGAEKALFRHLKNKRNKSPKYGFLFNHPLIQKASQKERGKIARMLADKIAIAARVDYFKGKPIGESLYKQVIAKCKISR